MGILNTVLGLVPEIMSFVRSFQNSNGILPTDAEIAAHLEANEDRVINIGQAWLDAHPNA